MRISLFLILILYSVVWLQCNGQGSEETCEHQPKKVPEGRSCRKQCETDDDCKGGSKSCNCDNVCGMSCFNPNADCDKLEDIENGNIDVKGTTYNSVAEYSCDAGFTLRGESKRTCQSDRQWSGKAPECVESSCRFPSRTTAGFPDVDLSQSVFKVGDVVTYKCRYGFTLSGNPNVTCQSDHKWSPVLFVCSKVSCGEPEEPLNGYVEAENFLFGSWATYKCNEGYEIANPAKARRYCSTTAKWSSSPATCEIKSCPPPESPMNGDVQYSSTTYGSVVRYLCDQGYILRGNKEGLCNDDGTWGESPICEVDINCKFEKSVRPLCGYTNEGESIWERTFLESNREGLPTYAATSQGDGRKAILRSPIIPDGKSHCVKFYYYTEKAQASNDLMIELNGERVANLASDGVKIPRKRWVGYQTSLVPEKSEFVIDIVFHGNAQIWIDELQVDKGECGSSCSQQNLCQNGGKCVDEIESSYCSCTEGFKGTRCDTDVTCEKPQIRNGIVRGPDKLIYGSRLSFSCIDGYERRGPSFATCTGSGLSNDPPKCFEIVSYDGECPQGFNDYQLMCYKFYKDSKTYDEAAKVCQSKGAQLVTVQSRRVDKYLFDNSFSWPLNYYIWTGLRSNNFRQFWESGNKYEGGEGVDFDFTRAGNGKCGAYHYVARPFVGSLWQIGFHDCGEKKYFICETWKKTATSYRLWLSSSSHLQSLSGIYRPVPGLVTESARQIFRKNNNGIYTYLYHAFHPDVGLRRWYIGDYSVRHANPGYWNARASSDEIYPDNIDSTWRSRDSVIVSISITKYSRWGGWSTWQCAVTCGQGMRARYRFCEDGNAGSMDCRGSDSEQLPCYRDPCPLTSNINEIEYKKKAYSFVNERLSWHQAKDRCQGLNRKLALLNEYNHLQTVKDKLKEVNQRLSTSSYWINGKRENRRWKQANGMEIYTDQWMWMPGEPNFVGRAPFCIELFETGWNDHHCGEGRPFICERDLPSNPCERNPCQSVRVCRQNGDGYVCDCPQGKVEPYCEDAEPSGGKQVSKNCVADPCNSGGKCVEDDNEDGFLCYCSPDRKGKYCEHDRDEPDILTTSYASIKPTQMPLPTTTKGSGSQSGDPCIPDPCNKGGRCTPSETDPMGFVCFCKTGNLGQRCEIKNACSLGGITGDVRLYRGEMELSKSDAISEGEELLLKCSNLDEDVLGTQVIKCLGGGQWSRNTRVSCASAESICTQKAVDSAFEVFLQSDEQVKSFPVSVESGSYLRFKCDDGNGRTEGFVIGCENGKWKSSVPTRCAAPSCPDIEAPANGAMQVTPVSAARPYEPGTRISFSCNKPYRLKGASVMICGKDGWSSAPPTCAESGCFIFYFDLNRDVYVKDHKNEDIEAQPGDSYVLKCEESKKKETVRCKGNDVWEPGIDTFTCS